jgi:hypothetical protein
MKPLKERVSLTVDGDILQRMKEQADLYDRSLSQLVNIVLRDYLDSETSSERIKIVLQGK